VTIPISDDQAHQDLARLIDRVADDRVADDRAPSAIDQERRTAAQCPEPGERGDGRPADGGQLRKEVGLGSEEEG
jgi:hypothetical protein